MSKAFCLSLLATALVGILMIPVTTPNAATEAVPFWQLHGAAPAAAEAAPVAEMRLAARDDAAPKPIVLALR